MIGVTCGFLYDYHMALLAFCVHAYLLLCIGCHLGWGSVTIDPVSSWDYARIGNTKDITSLVP